MSVDQSFGAWGLGPRRRVGLGDVNNSFAAIVPPRTGWTNTLVAYFLLTFTRRVQLFRFATSQAGCGASILISQQNVLYEPNQMITHSHIATMSQKGGTLFRRVNSHFLASSHRIMSKTMLEPRLVEWTPNHAPLSTFDPLKWQPTLIGGLSYCWKGEFGLFLDYQPEWICEWCQCQK